LTTTAAVTSVRGPASHDLALTLYGKARAFELVGDCASARSAYGQYADAVRAQDPKSAEMAISYASLCWTRANVNGTLSEATSALLGRDPKHALELLDADTTTAWSSYERGVALAELRRTDEAAKAFDLARDGFTSPRERGLAVYGKARAYHDVLRCSDASSAYQEYAALSNPADGQLALAYARDCVKHTFPTR
jgi:tetratricopeptide (TPR) repeat protein